MLLTLPIDVSSVEWNNVHSMSTFISKRIDLHQWIRATYTFWKWTEKKWQNRKLEKIHIRILQLKIMKVSLCLFHPATERFVHRTFAFNLYIRLISVHFLLLLCSPCAWHATQIRKMNWTERTKNHTQLQVECFEIKKLPKYNISFDVERLHE